MSNLLPSQWTASTNQESNALLVGNPQQTYYVENAGNSWSFSNPGGDNSTLRFELRPGDHWSSAAWTDPSTSERDEISASTKIPVGTSTHISYDFELEPGAANTASWMVIGQMHQAASTWSPPFAIEMVGEKMEIVIDTAGNSANSWSQYKAIWVDPQNITRGETYHFDINVQFDATNGHLDVSRDGVQLVNYNGPLGWGSDMGSYTYWKEGIYRSASDTTVAADYSHLSITTGDTPTVPGGPSSPTQPETGTSAADTLTGTADVANHIRGGDGDDLIVGANKFNDINGNQGNDTITGKSTVGDWLLGGQGNDSIDATASTGHNVVNGNLGTDTLSGGSGGDTLRGGQGDDVIHAGNGGNWISGDLGNNTIFGGQGNDTFHGSGGHDTINGWHAGDHVQLDAGVTATTTQVGADVHVVLSNGGEMDLLNTQVNSLQSGWLI